MTRKDVISWLEYLSNDARSKADGIVPTNIEIACRMAIDALKEQEPRVMTLEEVKLLAPDDDVWIEYHELDGWTISAVTVREIYDNGMLCRLQCLRFNLDRYGCYGGDWMAWRCWTSRPDEKRRDEIPWG